MEEKNPEYSQPGYPLLGDTVTYIRHCSEGVKEGTGIMKGIGLDPDNRVICNIQSSTETDKEGNTVIFNTFERAVNPSDDFRKSFTTLVKKIGNITEKGNGDIKRLVDKSNKEIDKLHNELLGPPIKFEDVVPEDVAEDETTEDTQEKVAEAS